MRFEGKPKKIREAILKGDEKFLSNAGKVGASHRLQLEELAKARKAEDIAQREMELAKEGFVNDEGDILPPNSTEPLGG